MTRRRRGRAFLPLLCLLGGCMPHVMHGPRVEPGLSGAITASVGRNIDLDADQPTYVPSLYGGLRWGGIAADGRSALSIGAQLPPVLLGAAWSTAEEPESFREVALATSYADLYAQPPGWRGREWDAGLGALASSALLAPYVQVGRSRADGSGWYLTNLVAFIWEPLFDDGLLWAPSVAWRDVGKDGSAAHFGAAGGIGRDRSETVWWVGATLTIELGLPRQADR